jgi:hypothetical protein
MCTYWRGPGIRTGAMVRRRGLRLPAPPGDKYPGPGTELDADDPGIWLVLQSHHGAGARADLPGAVPVARRGRARGPAEHLRDVDEGDCPAGEDAAAGGGGEAGPEKIIFPPAESCQVPCSGLSWANCSPPALHTAGSAGKTRCRATSAAHVSIAAVITSASSANRHPRREICPGVRISPRRPASLAMPARLFFPFPAINLAISP